MIQVLGIFHLLEPNRRNVMDIKRISIVCMRDNTEAFETFHTVAEFFY